MESLPLPKRLICFYAEEDQSLWEQLKKHLRVLEQRGLLSLWDSRDIPGGADRAEAVTQQFATAAIILLLLSAGFVADHEDIIQRALEQKKLRDVLVVPVILRPVDWQHAGFRTFQVLPKHHRPIVAWPNLDAALESVAQGIRELVAPPSAPFDIKMFSPLSPQKKIPASQRLRLPALIIAAFAFIILLTSLFTLPALLRQNNAVPHPTATDKPLPTLALVSPTATSAPTSSASTPIPTPTAPIVPAGSPTVNDPLQDNSQGLQWDETNAAYGSCGFVQGKYYLLKAPAHLGLGCNTEANPQSVFGNMVFQMTMTILSGMDNTQSGAGPTFRIDPTNNALFYKVSFDALGNWHLWVSDANTSTILPGALCDSPCPYFHKGLNQPNVFTIRAIGNTIDFWVNGYLIDSCSDNTYTSGFLGVQLGSGTHPASVAFSNLRIWRV